MRPFWLAAIIVVVDQITKIVVRTSMQIGDSIPLMGDWLKLTFTENPGMAFGISLGSSLVVTILAIIATSLIVIYLRAIRDQHVGYRTSLSLILGGAIGNIIDRIFYARIFEYGEFFRGEVVDFIHIDLWSGRVPEWVPLLGDRYMALFPIWNVADMSIVVGVACVLFFQKAYQHERLSGRSESEVDTLAEPSESAAVVPAESGPSTP
ncbi:MAG TPA: signal peptidase II [Rhodothermia bacterium]